MNSTQQSILKLLTKPHSPRHLSEQLGFSRTTIHIHLRELLDVGKVTKQGSGSHVLYCVQSNHQESRIQESYDYFNTLYSVKKFPNTLKTGFSGKTDRGSAGEKLDFSYHFNTAVVYSSNIEGNSLDISSYMNSQNLPKKIKQKEVQEIDDLKTAYLGATELKIKESTLLKLHKILSRSFVSPARAGKYRKEVVGVFSDKGIEYMAIEADLVTSEMKELFTIIRKISTEKTGKELYYWAAWIHLMFVLIHPFSDGNGRMGRLLEKWFLSECVGDSAWALQTEQWYFKHRKEYYRALKLGVNYWEVDFSNADAFMDMMPKILGR